MGAHPKNKITSVERGKRRAGNTPKLAKQIGQSRVPLHKKSMLDRFIKAVTGATTKAASKKQEKKATKVQKSGLNTQLSGMKSNPSMAPVKITTHTQHKGG